MVPPKSSIKILYHYFPRVHQFLDDFHGSLPYKSSILGPIPPWRAGSRSSLTRPIPGPMTRPSSGSQNSHQGLAGGQVLEDPKRHPMDRGDWMTSSTWFFMISSGENPRILMMILMESGTVIFYKFTWWVNQHCMVGHGKNPYSI